MNVLIISHMYPSKFNSMSGIFVHKQVKSLVKLGCKVKVVCPVPWSGFPLSMVSSKWKKYSEIPKKEVIDGIEVYYPRYIEFPKGYHFDNSGKRMYDGVKKLIIDLAKENKFHVIHSNVAFPDGYCGMLINKELRIPHVVTIHGQDFQNTIKRSEILEGKVFEVLRDVDKVIVVSNKLKNIVKDEDFLHKIEVISNGIDVEDCEIEENTVSVPKDIDILSACNLVSTKGIDLNIKAVSKLVSKYPNLKYYIVGDGIERENLKELVRGYNLHENVVFTGRLEHQDVMKYMKNCKIFSLPSWQEGFGVAYVEAMLQGKPVIGVKGEGIEDVIEHEENGLLVRPRSLEDLIKKIEYLIDNPGDARGIGERAKKTVINNYTWENNAKKTLDVYHTAIKRFDLDSK